MTEMSKQRKTTSWWYGRALYLSGFMQC